MTGYYIDESDGGEFLDARPLRYKSGSRADALRRVGIDPDLPPAERVAAINAQLRAEGLPAVPTHVPIVPD